jgi:post-segregation antitoxin (ccd killing protein)
MATAKSSVKNIEVTILERQYRVHRMSKAGTMEGISGLKQAIGDEKARRWAEENREAIAAWNRHFEENDTPLAEFRAF